MKKEFYLIIFLLIFCKCANSTNHKNNNKFYCDSIAMEVARLNNDYFMNSNDDNFIKLDSSLTIIDSVIGRCPKYNANFYMNRIVIYSIKKEYATALRYAELMSDTLFSEVYKYVIVNRFKAMIAQAEGNEREKNIYINKIIDELHKQITDVEIDKILASKNPDTIMANEKFIYIKQYFYYMAQIKGIQQINSYLMSKYNDSQDDYLWIIKPNDNNDFMSFEGF